MLERAKSEFQRLNFVRPEELRPCTEEEVGRLELALRHAIPEVYYAFLLWMGHGAGRFVAGTDAFYDYLFRLHEWALELLGENHFPHPLPDDAFVFYMHQGYLFYFLRIGEGDRSPVYYFAEGKEQEDFLQPFHDFEEFLIAEMRGSAEAWEKIRNNGPWKSD